MMHKCNKTYYQKHHQLFNNSVKLYQLLLYTMRESNVLIKTQKAYDPDSGVLESHFSALKERKKKKKKYIYICTHTHKYTYTHIYTHIHTEKKMSNLPTIK